MDTHIWKISDTETAVGQKKIRAAARYLAEGELVAFPTETVYGLGANALADEAVSKVFAAKGRPSDNPLIVHIAGQEDLFELVEHIPETAEKLMAEFWPGPLTLVFNSKPNKFSSLVTAGLDSIAIRMPDHPIALAIIRSAGVPIAAPSANLSGRPSPTTAAHVYEDLAGLISGIVDGGGTKVGVESTVVDVTRNMPIILRQGGITQSQLESCVGKVLVDPGLSTAAAAPKSPGQKYQHYAPRAPFILISGSPVFIQEEINKMKAHGKKVGIYTWQEHKSFYQADVIAAKGSKNNLASVAETMYAELRAFDQTKVDIIFGEVVPRQGIGEAIMDRLRRASGNQTMKEMTDEEFQE